MVSRLRLCLRCTNLHSIRFLAIYNLYAPISDSKTELAEIVVEVGLSAWSDEEIESFGGESGSVVGCSTFIYYISLIKPVFSRSRFFNYP